MGTLSAVLVFAMLAVALCTPYDRQESSPDWAESTTENMNKSVLDKVPLIMGINWLASSLRNIAKYQLINLDFDRDLTHDPKWNTLQTDLPRLRKGKVGAQFFGAIAYCESQYKDAALQTMEQIDVIKRLTAKYPNDMKFVDSAKGIEQAFAAGKIGTLIGVQGGHSIDSRIAVLRQYYDLGVRYLTLTHTCATPWAGGQWTDTSRGLSDFGLSVVREMNRLGMIVDLSRTSYQTMRDALAETKAPVIFSLSAASALCNMSQNVPDDILNIVKENKGLVMVSFYSGTLQCGPPRATWMDVVAHINHIKEVIGVDHVGIGGGFQGYSTFPVGLKDVSHLPYLFEKLRTAVVNPWTDEDLMKLAGLNLLRVFKAVEKVRDDQKSENALEELLPESELPKEAHNCRTDL